MDVDERMGLVHGICLGSTLSGNNGRIRPRDKVDDVHIHYWH